MHASALPILLPFVAVLLAFTESPAHASPHLPFVPLPGTGTAAVTTSAFISRLDFDEDGAATANAGFRAMAIDGDIEVGIGEGLAVQLGMPVRHVSFRGVDGVTRTVRGVGDARGALHLVVFDDGPLQLRLSGEVKVPLYDGAPTARERVPSSRSLPLSPGNTPALGDGQVDVAVVAGFAAGLPLGGTFSWRTGYRLRTGGVTDAVIGGGAFTVDVLNDRLAPGVVLDFVWSLDPAVDVDGAPREAVGRGIAALGGICRVRLPEIASGLALDVSALLLSRGRNAVGGVTVGAGVAYAF